MVSFDSSPNYTRAATRFDAKKENSPGGSQCDDIISVSSSTCGSSINGPYAPKLNDNGIKHRTNSKKTLKNFGSIKSFRRRAKSRIFQSPIAISDDAIVDSSQSSPHYLKATSCSSGKKTRSSDDSSDKNSSHKSLQTISRTSSLRSMRILIKKASFKPKRASLNYSKVSEDDSVDRATYSSTLKDSKFPKPVELHPAGTAETDKVSALKVCRYHHCSLHGHCHAGHDAVPPPPKRFLYKKMRSLKKQKSMIPKTESRPGAKNSSGKNKNIPKSQTVPIVDPSNQESINDNMNGVDSCTEICPKQETRLFGDVEELDLIEVAFGETSFPERSYQDNLDVLGKYSSQEQEFGGTSFWMNGYCLRCSSHNSEQATSTPGRADANSSLLRVTSSNLDNGYKNEVPQNGNADVLDKTSSALFKNEASNPETPAISDDVTTKNSVFSSASDNHTSPDSYFEEEGEITAESNPAGDPKVNEVMQDKDSERNSTTHEAGKLQFSKQRHISMWHLIHQHMSSNLAADQSAEKPLQSGDGESPLGGVDSLLAKQSSCRDLSDSDMGSVNNDSETQEIEIRKLFAIKLVREAIEKILLPEVQDQASDDQSVTSVNTPQPEIIEKNQSEVCGQENHPEFDAKEGHGLGVNVLSNLNDEKLINEDSSGPEIKETGKKVARISENKAPKHWSNLKKWILLQRFIRALEKVRKFNPKKPNYLPLNPDPEAEKVNLRPQTVDGKKNAEEWMLDYALRQAVNQLAPTQKRKVALLVKAFETVVPTQEEPHVQFRISRLKDNSLDISRNKEDEPVNGKAALASDDRVSVLDSESQENGTKLIMENEKPFDLNNNSGESRIGVKIDYSDDGSRPSNENIKPEVPDSEKGQPSSTTHSLILDGNGRSVATEDNLGAANRENIMANETEREAEKDAISDTKDSGQGIQMDRKNHIKMWHMICQHVVSGIAEKIGSQLLDGSEDDEAGDNNSPAIKSDDYSNDSSQSTDESSQKIQGFTKSDALKLIKEAVDEILLRETQDDSSVTQSVTSESISDQEISVDTKAESQPEPPKPKNWSKLKKLILLKRSIRALEKARKDKGQPRHLSPQRADHEPEKVDLRRQMTDERKKAEQWMLDYAVQHIVTKLTPARKRRVSMLVEAFEAVVPFPEM